MDPLFLVNLQAAHHGMLQHLEQGVPFKRAAVEVMLCLDPRRPVTQREVCQRTQHRLMAVSQAVRALKVRGLVKGRPSPEDRRVTELTLTGAGVKAYEMLQAGLKKITAAHDHTLVESMREFQAALRQSGYRARQGP